MPKAKKVESMTRAEHIREESKRAAEFGMTPRAAMSLAKNFRVSRSSAVQFSAGSTMIPARDVADFNDRDFDPRAVQHPADKLVWKLPAGAALDGKTLEKMVAAEIERLSPETIERVLPNILARMNAAALLSKESGRIQALRQKLSERILGPGKYKDVAGKPGGGRPAKEG